MTKLLLSVFKDPSSSHVPFWFMRQAGRYLPEYREVRKEMGSFMNLALTPDKACEVTVQPIRRYGMSGAILFSDILMIPYGLGIDVTFVEGKGPQLTPTQNAEDLEKLSFDHFDRLNPVYEALGLIKSELDDETTLIGFCGAPWTVATYMVEGGPSKDYRNIKKWMYSDPESFQKLMDILVEASAQYLKNQVLAGAEVLQIFDSWSGLLPTDKFEKYSIEPTKRIIELVKQEYPDVPIIGFPRGAGHNLFKYVRETGVDGVSLDETVDLDLALENIDESVVLQGNLDNGLLLSDEKTMLAEAERILEKMKDRRFIFNLGHGVIRFTEPDQIGTLSEFIKSWKK